MKRAVTHRGEFGRIARYFAPLAQSHPGAFGLRDDAAVIAPRAGHEFVVTTDTIVAGVHYIGDETPELIASKLMRVNLSDLAAMGATPRAYTLNIALPAETDDQWVEAFASGLAEDQAQFGIVLIGGDSVGTLGPPVFTLTALGEVPIAGAIRRDGAHAGDKVFVSGTIGDGALGLRALRDQLAGISSEEREWLAGRYRQPEPRLALGRRLFGIAHAAADISDGLVADLAHIADASGVAATIDASAVPLSPAACSVLGEDNMLEQTVLTGGDDYELVICAPPQNEAALQSLAKEIELPLTVVGSLYEGDGVRVINADGDKIQLDRAGFSHG